MIIFDRAVKRYQDGTVAVHDLDLVINEGELCVLVGPSGCGKTTSLRMINRMVDPTSGSVRVNGTNVMDIDPPTLRRGIGYVIQSGGLFPHRTVAQNIGAVMQLNGSKKRAIQERAMELLNVVGLDSKMADRYPHQLSGGQQQRVGVARALAADPPILLMDEPFGAVDPLVRVTLQEELVRLQSRLKKTIVFVTHDIEEAVKLGDRIAVFSSGGRLAQYDTPLRLLANPEEGFVADFLGTERGLLRLSLQKVADVPLEEAPQLHHDASGTDAIAVAERFGSEWVVVTDDEHRPLGWVETSEAEGLLRLGDLPPHPFDVVLPPDASLRLAIDTMLSSRQRSAMRVDEQGRYVGVISTESLSGAAFHPPAQEDSR